MSSLKTQRVGKYQVTKYPKAVWVRSLPYGRTVKRCKTWTSAINYAKKKDGEMK